MAEEKKIDRGEYHKKTAGGGFTALKCSRCEFDIEKGIQPTWRWIIPGPIRCIGAMN